MRMFTCENGHYYDQDKYSQCPYCFGEGTPTEATKHVFAEDEGKTSLYQMSDSDDEQAANSSLEDPKTVFQMSENIEEPAVETHASPSRILLSGWLAIASQQGQGQSFPLIFGMNRIGRGEENQVAIQNGDGSISRDKHAIIIYDFENNLFFLKHDEGQFLTYLNGEVVLDTKVLQPYDRIRVGSTELIFVPLCGEKFQWDK